MMQDRDPPAGGRMPPHSGRFPKGTSGNPRGRPRKADDEALPYEAVLGEPVTIVDENGASCEVTLEQAFLERIIRRGMQGDATAIQHALKAGKTIEEIRGTGPGNNIRYVTVNRFLPSVNDILVPLRMVYKSNPLGPAPRILIEGWLIESALAKLGDRRLLIATEK